MFDKEAPGDTKVLDLLPAGPALAALLAAIDLDDVTAGDRVVIMRAHQRLASHYAARVYDDMAVVSEAIHEHEDDFQLAHDSAAAEVGVALRLTRRAADRELSLALDLRHRLPAVHRLLSEGRIDARRARVIADHTAHLSRTSAREVVAAILDDAPDLTTGQLAGRLRRSCIDAAPDDARDRYQHASEQRRVTMEPTVDGTAHLLGLDLPPERVQQARDHINTLATALRTDRETRSIDQLRADVFLDLLTGATTTRAGTVDIRVDLTTLTELADHPGDLAGYGPLIADITRRVARDSAGGEWRFTVADPRSGKTHTGITRRRPTTGQRRSVETRDTTCIFPGCRMPATQSDLDHTERWADGGPTREDNLAPLCRHHHRIKESGWSYVPLGDAIHRWTSKLGHTYTAGGRSP